MTTTVQAGGLVGRRILVVEDTYFIADDVAQALQSVGATVVGPAPDREQALKLLASEPVDVAVLDINLRGETAFPVADLLLAQGRPFVFATGYGAASIPDAYRHVARWEKPFDLKALMRALPDLLRDADPVDA